MASFDAGSIDARLTLDRTPFSEGLRLARAEADDFRDIEVNLRLNTQGEAGIARLREELATLRDGNVNVGLDTGVMTAELERIKMQLDELHGQTVRVNLDIVGASDLIALNEAIAHLDGKNIDLKVELHNADELFLLNEEVDHLDGKNIDLHVEVHGAAELAALQAEIDAVDGGGAGGRSRGGGGLPDGGAPGLMMTAIAALAPVAAEAIVPLTAAIAGFGAAGVAAAGGVGVLALVIKPLITDFEKQEKAIAQTEARLSTLTPGTKAYNEELAKLHTQQAQLNEQYAPMVAGMDHWRTAYGAFKEQTREGGMQIVASAFNLGAQAVGHLVPVFNAFAPVIRDVLHSLGGFVNGPEMAGMIHFFVTFGPTALSGFLHILGNVAQTLGNLAAAFAPFGVEMVQGLDRITAGWAQWAAQLGSTQKFQDFIDYARTNGPSLLSTLVEVAKALVHVGEAIAPLGVFNAAGIKLLAEAVNMLPPGVIEALAIAFGLWTVGMWAYTAATTAAGIATAILDAAASPFVLAFAATIGVVLAVVAALVALGIGIYELATRTQFFQTIWHAIWDAAKYVWGQFVEGIHQGVDAVTTAWDWVSSATSTAWGAVTGAVSAAGRVVSEVVSAVVGVVRGVWDAYWGTFGPVFTAIWNLVVATVKLAVVLLEFEFLLVVAVAKRMWSDVTTTFHNALAVISVVANAIGAVLSAAWNLIRSAATTAWNAVSSAISGPLHTAEGVVSTVVGAIGSAISTGWHAVTSATSTAWNSLVGAISGPLHTAEGYVSGAITTIRGYFADAGSWLYGAGKAVVQGLIDGIASMIQSVADAISSVTKTISDHLPGSPVKEGPLRVLNNGYAGGQIAQMIAGGITDHAFHVRQAMGDLTDLAGMQVGGTGYINGRLGIVSGTSGASGGGGGTPAASGDPAMLAEMRAMRKATEALTAETAKQNDAALVLKRQGAI